MLARARAKITFKLVECLVAILIKLAAARAHENLLTSAMRNKLSISSESDLMAGDTFWPSLVCPGVSFAPPSPSQHILSISLTMPSNASKAEHQLSVEPSSFSSGKSHLALATAALNTQLGLCRVQGDKEELHPWMSMVVKQTQGRAGRRICPVIPARD